MRLPESTCCPAWRARITSYNVCYTKLLRIVPKLVVSSINISLLLSIAFDLNKAIEIATAIPIIIIPNTINKICC